MPAAVLLTLVRIESDVPLQLINIIGYYFLASYTAYYVLGIGATQDTNTIYIFLAIIGFLFLLLQGMINIGQIQQYHDNLLGLFALLFGMIMYIIVLFIPRVGYNGITMWFINIVSWIRDIPVIGWVISLFAFINALYILFVGFVTLLSFIGQLSNTMKKGNSM